MNKKVTKVCMAIVLTFCLVISEVILFSNQIVYAVQNNAFQITGEGQSFTLGGSNRLVYNNGEVTVTYGEGLVPSLSMQDQQDDSTQESSIGLEDTIYFSFNPNGGYEAKIQINGQDREINNNEYTFTYTEAKFCEFIITFEENGEGGNGGQQQGSNKATLLINGELFEDVEWGSELYVGQNFDFNKINIIVKSWNDTNYPDNNFATGKMINNGLDAFEIRSGYTGTNIKKIGFEFHADSPANLENYPGVHMANIKLIKSDYRGLECGTQNNPDMYDFSTFQAVDLADTTEEEPGQITVYYGNDSINLGSATEHNITNIKLGAGVPENAVEINLDDKVVTVLSAFYDEIPLIVTLGDGTVGYLVVKRVGIEITMNGDKDGHGNNITAPLHGAVNNGTEFPAEYLGKSNLTAVFYHSAETSYEDYNLVVNLIYKDGTKETKIVSGYGDVTCLDNMLEGADFILWSGDKDNAPIAANVTAINANAISKDSFGGASFGSGSGVEWKID